MGQARYLWANEQCVEVGKFIYKIFIDIKYAKIIFKNKLVFHGQPIRYEIKKSKKKEETFLIKKRIITKLW